MTGVGHGQLEEVGKKRGTEVGREEDRRTRRKVAEIGRSRVCVEAEA